MRKLYTGLAVLFILSPLGLLASGSAWGEWSSVELKKMVGFAPQGLTTLESIWPAPLTGYALPGAGGAFGYLISGAVGIGSIFIVFALLGRFFAKDDVDDNT